MDPDDPTSIILKKIRTLEPDNAPKLIGYFLLQDMEQTDLIRLAFGPDTLLHTFCCQAKSHLGLSSKPISIHQTLSQSSPSNGFSTNPNPNFDSRPFLEDPFANLHKRSFSPNEACLEPEEPGFGAGYRFSQTGLVDGFGSSSGESGYVCLQREEMMRMKLAQQQRVAQLMALRQGEESGYCYSPSRHGRDDFVSRQIYLTFPSESSFTDADVSSYFSDFGAVEDVRIPYQQQRMYGFVTFSNAETVRTILARGNPHFICESRVLVKPYKEKGKILQNKWQQQQLQQLMERGSYSPSSSPSEMDLYECHLGPRMFSRNTQEMMRRKADVQRAIEVELQRRRFLALQLPGRENESVHHLQRSLSMGSPSHLPPRFNHSLLFQPESSMEETTEGDSDRGESHLHLVPNNNKECRYSNEFHNRQETSPEKTLPDSLFGFPIKSEETLQTESDTKAEEWVVEKEKEENFNHLMDSSVEKTRDPCCLMKTHFLKPYVTSIDGPVAELPPRRRQRVSSSSDVKVLTLRRFDNGVGSTDRTFTSWMRKMEALHEPTWRKAGIFEAIKASTFKISKNPSLIQALVEKWCPETKSFVFPWGEATITLEDVMVLLGFSVLGSSVCASVESSEMRGAVKKLEKARTMIMGGKGGQVRQSQWTLRFRDRDDDSLEHEAFLAMWLSILVFPHMSRRSISRRVFAIAVRLARGERVALAPAVLASVYRDLGAITGDDESYHPKSLLKLVQVWTWERFKNVRPKAKEIPKGEPRISRWEGLQKKYENVRMSLDDFEWRPYTKPLQNWNPLRFYVEEAMWIPIDNGIDDEFVAFARCVRSSKLVGIGFVEDYYPNRVAMQFGFSQDLPGLVTRHSSDFTEKEAWDDYNKSLVGLKLYMPSRLSAGSVTMRYRDWWVKSVSQFLGFEESNETCDTSNAGEDDALLQKLGEGFPAEFKRSRKLRIARRMGSVSVEMPLSELFHKELAKRTSEHLRGKRAREDDDDANHTDSYDDVTISQLVKCRKITGGDASGSHGIRRRDNSDSGIYQELASGEDETVAPQEVEKRNEQNDEEETRSQANEITILPPPEARQTGVAAVNGRNNPENKKNVVDDGTKEAECLLHEDGEKPSRLATGSVTTRYRTGDFGASVPVEKTLSELFHKELAKRTSEDPRAREDDDDDENHMDSYDDITISQLVKCRKKDGGDVSGSLGIRRRDKDDNNDSRICQELASKDDETVTPLVIEPQTDEEETRSEAVETVVMIPCIGDTVLSPMKAGETCVDVNRSEAVVETVVDAGTKEAECLLDDERLKHRKLTTEELALNLEARFMKVEKTLETIRNWITKKRNHIQTL
uniref:RRM domain-containing protein n=2 Tax=Brassica campestris TaxID=3711 RepID=M4DQX0_BRACM